MPEHYIISAHFVDDRDYYWDVRASAPDGTAFYARDRSIADALEALGNQIEEKYGETS